jgi:tryptophanyl-tRNA synthetase
VISGQTIEQVVKHFEGKMYGHLKVELGELIVDYLAPIQQRFHQIRDDESYLNTVLKTGADNARAQAQQTLRDVQQTIGFVLS